MTTGFSKKAFLLTFIIISVVLLHFGAAAFFNLDSTLGPSERADGMLLGVLGVIGTFMVIGAFVKVMVEKQEEKNIAIKKAWIQDPANHIHQEAFNALRLAAPGLFQARKCGIVVSVPPQVREAMIATHGAEAQKVLDLLDGMVNLDKS